MTRHWSPSGTRPTFACPTPGQVVAVAHGVWRVDKVDKVDPAEWTDADCDAWAAAGMPDPWPAAPVHVHVTHLGGVKPETFGDRAGGTLTVRDAYYCWAVYPDGRWPMCSCCGEPMPCRAALEDRTVEQTRERLDELEQVVPGSCWACREPVTTRQDAVTYEGENLLLPGREPPTFHTRQACRAAAAAYEVRWVAWDLRRQRILTWPKCGGILVVHCDGSSECTSGRGPLGDETTGQPDCRGHLTHDHGAVRACFVGDAWLSRSGWQACERGCDPATHHGTATTKRPARRDRLADPGM